MTRSRTVGIFLLVLAALAATIWTAGEWYRGRDFLPYFKARHGELVTVHETLLAAGPTSSTYHLRLVNDSGLEVEAHLRVPAAPGPHPALVILGGLRAGRQTLDYISDSWDVVLIALDYPYRGKRSGLAWWEAAAALPAMEQGVLDTVPAAMLAVDYLWGCEAVDRHRIAMAGGSLGALFAPALAAADERLAAVAILFGAADVDKLLRLALPVPAAAKPPLAWIGGLLVSPLEPLKYIHLVSPRPVFMLNGTGDPRMPVVSARRLHEAAGEPKTVRWLDLGHVHIREPEFQKQVLDEILAWFADVGILTAARPEALSNAAQMPATAD